LCSIAARGNFTPSAFVAHFRRREIPFLNDFVYSIVGLQNNKMPLQQSF
jgi:hypothetical protein